MTAATLVGWVLAALALVLAALARRGLLAREEAVARACHELRGPLTAVRLGLSLSTHAGGLSRARLDALDTELDRAALALEDLAEMRVRSARAPLAEIERVSLARLLAETITAAEGRAKAASASVSGGWDGAEAVVWGDRLRLAQALGNLVANAIEHGGGSVHVAGTLRGGCARITVDDEGAGLPAPVDALARRPRAGRGTRGRGLAIALAIVHSHGGTISAAPVGRGGRVMLTLPASVVGRR